MTTWEYLVFALPTFDELGAEGWEAVGMTQLADGSVAVLLKRPAR